jgi:hypothetical protein
MKHISTLFSIMLALGVLVGCSSDVAPVVEPTNAEKYTTAIIDAMVADDNERSASLIALREDNSATVWKTFGLERRVLVTTWTSWDTSYAVGEAAASKYDMWVTAVPELRTWWKTRYDGRTDTTLRLEQLLGLSPGRKKIAFLSIWVRPQDVLRPAGDPEIDDVSAGPELGATVDSTYRAWFNASIIYSYYPKTAPWTRLGYTYDWNLQYGEQGLSEFIVRKGSPVIVESVLSTSNYLR